MRSLRVHGVQEYAVIMTTLIMDAADHSTAENPAAPKRGTYLYNLAMEYSWPHQQKTDHGANELVVRRCLLQYARRDHTGTLITAETFQKRCYLRIGNLTQIRNELRCRSGTMIRRLREGLEFMSFPRLLP